MRRTVRIFLGSLAFVGVSILSAVEQAPFVQAGDDAEAFTGPQNGDGQTSVGDQACNSNCMRAVGPECKGDKALTCMEYACNCETSVEKGKACSPRDPCAQPKKEDGIRQACINGVCLFQCQDDKDCGLAGGGVCRGGSCRARTADDVASCKVGCAACKRQVMACKDKLMKCIANCH